MNYLKFTIYLLILLSILFVLFINLSGFRKPSGKYGVGITIYHMIDKSRKEVNNPNSLRELMVYIYYPIDKKIEVPQAQYDQDALNSAKQFVSSKTGIPVFLFNGWTSIKTFAQSNAKISKDFEKYPVIIIPHGGGTMVQHYTWMLEELSSQGFIVIGVNHPYMAAITRMPDGRIIKSQVLDPKNRDKNFLEHWKNQQVEVCVQDLEFLIKELQVINSKDILLKNKFDLENIGCAGHSFGGHLALIMGIKNHHIKGVVDMDGGQRAFPYIIGKKYPTNCMIILADKSRQWRGERGRKDRQILEDFRLENPEKIIEVIVKNVGHGVFSDLSILMHSTLFSRYLSKFFDIDLDASSTECIKAINEISAELNKFFDKNLKKFGLYPGLLNSPSSNNYL